MKVFVVFALALATVSAASVPRRQLAVHPLDLPEITAQDERIVNGYPAYEGQFPYQVGLTLEEATHAKWCGGSLISPNWILTAAHCTEGVIRATVYLGSTVRTVAEVTLSITNSNFVQHRQYNNKNLENDISLIYIPAVSYSWKVNQIAIPAINAYPATYENEVGRASGWGLVRDGATAPSNHLNYVDLLVVSNEYCKPYYNPGTINAGTLCTDTTGARSVCQGDSGGPFVVRNVVVGVASFVSLDGCESGKPAGFVRVTNFLDWIRDNSGVAYYH